MKSTAASWKRFPTAIRAPNVASWTLVLAVFALAMIVSNRAVENIPNDLRRIPVLLLNALAGTIVALGFAAHGHSLNHWTDMQFSFRFGIWSAAVFRLLPPIMNEDVLYLRNCITFDAPYVVLGACAHGGLAVLFASPFASRVVEQSGWAHEKTALELCATTILVLFVIAGAVRLLSEHWW